MKPYVDVVFDVINKVDQIVTSGQLEFGRYHTFSYTFTGSENDIKRAEERLNTFAKKNLSNMFKSQEDVIKKLRRDYHMLHLSTLDYASGTGYVVLINRNDRTITLYTPKVVTVPHIMAAVIVSAGGGKMTTYNNPNLSNMLSLKTITTLMTLLTAPIYKSSVFAMFDRITATSLVDQNAKTFFEKIWLKDDRLMERVFERAKSVALQNKYYRSDTPYYTPVEKLLFDVTADVLQDDQAEKLREKNETVEKYKMKVLQGTTDPKDRLNRLKKIPSEEIVPEMYQGWVDMNAFSRDLDRYINVKKITLDVFENLVADTMLKELPIKGDTITAFMREMGTAVSNYKKIKKEIEDKIVTITGKSNFTKEVWDKIHNEVNDSQKGDEIVNSYHYVYDSMQGIVTFGIENHTNEVMEARVQWLITSLAHIADSLSKSQEMIKTVEFIRMMVDTVTKMGKKIKKKVDKKDEEMDRITTTISNFIDVTYDLWAEGNVDEIDMAVTTHDRYKDRLQTIFESYKTKYFTFKEKITTNGEEDWGAIGNGFKELLYKDLEELACKESNDDSSGTTMRSEVLMVYIYFAKLTKVTKESLTTVDSDSILRGSAGGNVAPSLRFTREKMKNILNYPSAGSKSASIPFVDRLMAINKRFIDRLYSSYWDVVGNENFKDNPLLSDYHKFLEECVVYDRVCGGKRIDEQVNDTVTAPFHIEIRTRNMMDTNEFFISKSADITTWGLTYKNFDFTKVRKSRINDDNDDRDMPVLQVFFRENDNYAKSRLDSVAPNASTYLAATEGPMRKLFEKQAEVLKELSKYKKDYYKVIQIGMLLGDLKHDKENGYIDSYKKYFQKLTEHFRKNTQTEVEGTPFRMENSKFMHMCINFLIKEWDKYINDPTIGLNGRKWQSTILGPIKRAIGNGTPLTKDSYEDFLNWVRAFENSGIFHTNPLADIEGTGDSKFKETLKPVFQLVWEIEVDDGMLPDQNKLIREILISHAMHYRSQSSKAASALGTLDDHEFYFTSPTYNGLSLNKETINSTYPEEDRWNVFEIINKMEEKSSWYKYLSMYLRKAVTYWALSKRTIEKDNNKVMKLETDKFNPISYSILHDMLINRMHFAQVIAGTIRSGLDHELSEPNRNKAFVYNAMMYMLKNHLIAPYCEWHTHIKITTNPAINKATPLRPIHSDTWSLYRRVDEDKGFRHDADIFTKEIPQDYHTYTTVMSHDARNFRDDYLSWCKTNIKSSDSTVNRQVSIDFIMDVMNVKHLQEEWLAFLDTRIPKNPDQTASGMFFFLPQGHSDDIKYFTYRLPLLRDDDGDDDGGRQRRRGGRDGGDDDDDDDYPFFTYNNYLDSDTVIGLTRRKFLADHANNVHLRQQRLQDDMNISMIQPPPGQPSNMATAITSGGGNAMTNIQGSLPMNLTSSAAPLVVTNMIVKTPQDLRKGTTPRVPMSISAGLGEQVLTYSVSSGSINANFNALPHTLSPYDYNDVSDNITLVGNMPLSKSSASTLPSSGKCLSQELLQAIPQTEQQQPKPSRFIQSLMMKNTLQSTVYITDDEEERATVTAPKKTKPRKVIGPISQPLQPPIPYSVPQVKQKPKKNKPRNTIVPVSQPPQPLIPQSLPQVKQMTFQLPPSDKSITLKKSIQTSQLGIELSKLYMQQKELALATETPLPPSTDSEEEEDDEEKEFAEFTKRMDDLVQLITDEDGNEIVQVYGKNFKVHLDTDNIKNVLRNYEYGKFTAEQ